MKNQDPPPYRIVSETIAPRSSFWVVRVKHYQHTLWVGTFQTSKQSADNEGQALLRQFAPHDAENYVISNL